MEKEKIDAGNKGALIGTIFKWSVILAIALIALFIFLCIRSDNAKKNSETVPTIATITSSENGEPIEKKYTITSEFLEKNLKNIGKLSTVETTYNGVITVETGENFLTNKSYSMYYIGFVTAGIDIEKINIDINETEVVVKIPCAEIQSLKVDPDSIVFADVKKALFNWQTIEDGIDGIKIAEKELNLQAYEDDIIGKANERTEDIIRSLLEDIVKEAEGERQLTVVRAEDADGTK